MSDDLPPASTPPARRRRPPWPQLLPAPLDAAPVEPIPADGSGVVRVAYNAYDWPLDDGGTASCFVYGDPDAPDGIYPMLWHVTHDEAGATVGADPRLFPVWERDDFMRPENRYRDLREDEIDALVTRYLAMSDEERSEAWRFYRSIRERLDGGVVLQLETMSNSDDTDTDYALYEIDPDGSDRPLLLSSYDQITPFATQAEAEGRAASEAERKAQAALAGDPGNDRLPF